MAKGRRRGNDIHSIDGNLFEEVYCKPRIYWMTCERLPFFMFSDALFANGFVPFNNDDYSLLPLVSGIIDNLPLNSFNKDKRNY